MKSTQSNGKLILQILLIFLITRAIMLGVYLVYCAIFNDTSGFEGVFGRWDTSYYRDIINNGYSLPKAGNGMANFAFFPLFPMAAKGLQIISGGIIPSFWCGIIVSDICLVLASYFAVKLIRDKGLTKGERGPAFSGLAGNGLLLAWLLMLGPLTVYFGMCYTEGMFLLWIVLFFYFADKKIFMLAGMFAMLAGTTRSVGCLLVIPLIMAMYSHYKESTGTGNVFKFIGGIFAKPSWLFSILMIPAGVFLFMIFLHFRLGDAWAFMHAQVAWRDDHFVPLVGVLGRHLIGMGVPRYTLSAWICVAAFVMYIWMFVKGLRKEAVWGIVSLLLPLTSHVMSTPRFISGSFVIWMGMYLLIKGMKPKMGVVFTGILYAGGIITIAMWCASARFMM